MELGVGGAIFVAVTFAAIGAPMVWLGKKGQRGQIDFAFGAHTKENTEPDSWRQAHQVTGKGLVLSGLGFIMIGVLFVLIVSFLNFGENVTAVSLLVLITLPTGLLIRATVRGMTLLRAKPSAP